VISKQILRICSSPGKAVLGKLILVLQGGVHHQLAVMWKEPGDQNPIATFSHLWEYNIRDPFRFGIQLETSCHQVDVVAMFTMMPLRDGLTTGGKESGGRLLSTGSSINFSLNLLYGPYSHTGGNWRYLKKERKSILEVWSQWRELRMSGEKKFQECGMDGNWGYPG